MLIHIKCRAMFELLVKCNVFITSSWDIFFSNFTMHLIHTVDEELGGRWRTRRGSSKYVTSYFIMCAQNCSHNATQDIHVAYTFFCKTMFTNAKFCTKCYFCYYYFSSFQLFLFFFISPCQYVFEIVLLYSSPNF